MLNYYRQGSNVAPKIRVFLKSDESIFSGTEEGPSIVSLPRCLELDVFAFFFAAGCTAPCRLSSFLRSFSCTFFLASSSFSIFLASLSSFFLFFSSASFSFLSSLSFKMASPSALVKTRRLPGSALLETDLEVVGTYCTRYLEMGDG